MHQLASLLCAVHSRGLNSQHVCPLSPGSIFVQDTLDADLLPVKVLPTAVGGSTCGGYSSSPGAVTQLHPPPGPVDGQSYSADRADLWTVAAVAVAVLAASADGAAPDGGVSVVALLESIASGVPEELLSILQVRPTVRLPPIDSTCMPAVVILLLYCSRSWIHCLTPGHFLPGSIRNSTTGTSVCWCG